MSTKECPTCKKIKSFIEFSNRLTAKDGKRSNCKVCEKESSRKWRQENPETYRKSFRETNLKQAFGLTINDFNILLEQQDGKCAICFCSQEKDSGRENFSVDHNHTTGKIRGLLCNLCNRALGMFKDNPKLTQRATEYLKNPPTDKILQKTLDKD